MSLSKSSKDSDKGLTVPKLDHGSTDSKGGSPCSLLRQSCLPAAPISPSLPIVSASARHSTDSR